MRIKAPLPVIMKKYVTKNLIVALGLTISDKQIVIELSHNSVSECDADQEICSILRDLKGYNIKSSAIRYSWESIRVAQILSYIARDIVLNGTLNIARALAGVKLDRDDGVLLCLINNGGIVFSIVKDPLTPVCFRIPSNDYYLVELKHPYMETLENDINDVFMWIDALWNTREQEIPSIKPIELKPVFIWRRQGIYYAIVRREPRVKGVKIFRISKWGLDIDIKE